MGARMKIYSGQRGFMLLESLIAILIFSFGVLGMVAINARSVQALSDTEYRTEAARLADEIAGQIALGVNRGADRTNPVAVKAAINGSLGGFMYSGSADAAAPGANAVQYILKNKVALLPGAGALNQTVALGGGFNAVTITLRWRGPSDQADRTHVLVTYIN